MGTMGIEPMTNGLLDQRSTDWAMRLTKEILFERRKKLFEARIELATSSVADWRDNQLHHPNMSQ